MTLGLTRQYPGGLPQEATGFVGRSRELYVLAGILRSARLVTVTGTAGVGKTRIALRAAAEASGRFADGVCYAELGGLRDPDLVLDTVAASLGLPGQDARPAADAVIGYLSGRQTLLVLDTCEHLIGACAALVAALLRGAPRVTVLATSRQPLDVSGEHVYPLPPLSVRGQGAAPDRGDAVQLFAQRAATAAPGFVLSGANSGEVALLC
jgi:predicted ATPase